MTNESTVAEMEPKEMNKEVGTETIGNDANAADSVGVVKDESMEPTNGSTEKTDDSATTDPATDDAAIIEALRAELAASEAKADELLDKLQRRGQLDDFAFAAKRSSWPMRFSEPVAIWYSACYQLWMTWNWPLAIFPPN